MPLDTLLRLQDDLSPFASFTFMSPALGGLGMGCRIRPRNQECVGFELFGLDGEWVLMIEGARRETFDASADLQAETTVWAAAMGAARWQRGARAGWALAGTPPRLRQAECTEVRPPWSSSLIDALPQRLAPLRTEWCWLPE